MQLSIIRDQVVIRRDPEYADMGNPRGDIYDDRFFIEASDENEVYAYREMFEDEARAETVLSVLQFQHNQDRLDPRDSDEWRFLRHRYGSEGWLEEEATLCRWSDGENVY